MDQLTRDFFSNNFYGYSGPATIEKDILLTNLPVVELPINIDTDFLLNLVKDENLNQVKRPNYPYETAPRMSSWDMKIGWSDGTVRTHYVDVYYKKDGDPVPFCLATGIYRSIQEYLIEKGFTIRLCMLSVFGPGGFLRPHRDIGSNSRPLSYFWLPLNDPPNSELKIYPYGTVKINLGSMYLLNQLNYVHAVRNESSEERKVLLGYIDRIDHKIEELTKNQIKTSYGLT